jgi:hypothetical protein
MSVYASVTRRAVLVNPGLGLIDYRAGAALTQRR